jgi:hypothetical protein
LRVQRRIGLGRQDEREKGEAVRVVRDGFRAVDPAQLPSRPRRLLQPPGVVEEAEEIVGGSRVVDRIAIPIHWIAILIPRILIVRIFVARSYHAMP